jgi:hypothetical protein
MTADKGPEERKLERESKLVGRDKASPETVEYLNQLRDNIVDDGAAEAVAMLHAQVNGDHPDYTRPPEREPFGRWHRKLAVGNPTVVSKTDTTATVEVPLNTFEFYDSDATVYARISDGDVLVDPVDSVTKTTPSAGTIEVTVDGLSADTEYNVRAVVEADHETGTDSDYSDPITFTTDAE